MTTPHRFSKLKVLLIPLLGAVLLAVLWRSDPTESSGEDIPVLALAERPPVAARESRPVQRTWPEFDLAEVIRYDPFAMTDPLLAAQGNAEAQARLDPSPQEEAVVEVAEVPRQFSLTDLRERHGVQAVFGTPKGWIVVINSQMFREGDLLEDGLRIVEIRPDRIVLKQDAP